MDNKLNIPTHVGIIMDGNGRWAQRRGLSRSLGHKAGADNLLTLCNIFLKLVLNIYLYMPFLPRTLKDQKKRLDI